MSIPRGPKTPPRGSKTPQNPPQDAQTNVQDCPKTIRDGAPTVGKLPQNSPKSLKRSSPRRPSKSYKTGFVESTVSGAIWRLTQRRHCLSQPFQAETANSYHAYTVTGKVGSNGQLTPCIRTFKLMLFNDTFVIIAFVFSLTFHNVFMKHGIKLHQQTMH